MISLGTAIGLAVAILVVAATVGYILGCEATERYYRPKPRSDQ